jgi:hypothetical protein
MQSWIRNRVSRRGLLSGGVVAAGISVECVVGELAKLLTVPTPE